MRGSGAVLYGAGATGGTINIITKSPARGEKRAYASAGIGSFATRDYRAGLALGGERVGLADRDGAVARAVPHEDGEVEVGCGADLVDGVEVLAAAARHDPLGERGDVPREEGGEAEALALGEDGGAPVQRGAVEHDARDGNRVRLVPFAQGTEGDVAAHAAKSDDSDLHAPMLHRIRRRTHA